MKNIILSLLHLKNKISTWAYCLLLPVKYNSSWMFYGRPLIMRRRSCRIMIGDRFIACSNPQYNSIGVSQPVMLRACYPGAEIIIGNDVGVSGCTISAHRSITIGSHVLVGSGALITDSDAHPLSAEERRSGGDGASEPVIIEDDVFIGARAIILKGVTLGKGCVVGAGAVVTKDVPSGVIVAGNPAKMIGRIDKVHLQ